ncbi:MAG: DUF4391 domain-containing protein [Anaerotignum sp.]
MLGFPKATECSRQLPKKAIYAKFNMDNVAKDKFDAEVSRIMIVNEVTPKTTTLAAGTEIQGFYVLQVSLKRRNFDSRVIAQLPKLIDQKMVLLLECGGEGQLAVYHGKLICSPWRPLPDCSLQLNGLDLDAAWESLITQIGGIQIESGNTLDEQIQINTQREQIAKEIARLEKLARRETQPRRKLELVRQIQKLKTQ